ALRCAEFHPNGFLVAVGGMDCVVRCYDVRNFKQLQEYTVNGFPVLFALTKIIPGEGEQEGQRINRNLQTQLGDWCATEKIRLKPVNVVSFSDDGSYFATGGQDNQVFLWKTGCDTSDKENGRDVPSPKVSLEVLRELPDLATTQPSKPASDQVNVPSCPPQETTASHKMQQTVDKLTAQLLTLSQTVSVLEGRLGAAEDRIRELSSASCGPSLPTA
ncbi:unnamed protein product, partial [Ixodes pacificus]